MRKRKDQRTSGLLEWSIVIFEEEEGRQSSPLERRKEEKRTKRAIKPVRQPLRNRSLPVFGGDFNFRGTLFTAPTSIVKAQVLVRHKEFVKCNIWHNFVESQGGICHAEKSNIMLSYPTLIHDIL